MAGAVAHQWEPLLSSLGAVLENRQSALEGICSRYCEPGRFYHTLGHIEQMLSTVDGLSYHVRNLGSVQLAVWLHDVIYDSRANDNEERCADYAVRLCESLRLTNGPIVAALILKTKTHDPGDDPDAKVLLDADLAILGASEADYRRYAHAIRQEYAWVPEAEYRPGRRKVLEHFLKRPQIYHYLLERDSACATKPDRRNQFAQGRFADLNAARRVGRFSASPTYPNPIPRSLSDALPSRRAP